MAHPNVGLDFAGLADGSGCTSLPLGKFCNGSRLVGFSVGLGRGRLERARFGDADLVECFRLHGG